MREYTTFPTQDDAIAAALSESAPGELVEVHSESCKIDEDPATGEASGCTCEPMTLVAGAEA